MVLASTARSGRSQEARKEVREMSSLRRWEPFRSLMDVQTGLDRVFEEFFGPSLARQEAVRAPTIDVSETADEVVVRAEVPGVDKEGLEVEALPESLSIRAEMSEEKEEKEQTYHRRERLWRRYERLIALPAEVVADRVKATMKDGVLEVRMPKTERSKAPTPKKITVE
jgi:HSP20 family protein